MTIEVEAPPARPLSRLSARSSVAVADIELARHTLADLLEQRRLEGAGERVLDRLRRFVERDSDGLNSRS